MTARKNPRPTPHTPRRPPAYALQLLALLACFTAPVLRAGSPGDPPGRQARFDAWSAIERVYHEQRLWPKDNPGEKPPFEQVAPGDWLMRRTDAPALRTLALEKYWGVAISRNMLQGELDRMVRDSRDRKTLAKLFAALHNDPEVIAETLARDQLSERLLRGRYLDTPPDDELRRPGGPAEFDAWWSARSETLRVPDGGLRAAGAEPYRMPEVPPVECDNWETTFNLSNQGVVRRKNHTAVWTGSEMIVWGGRDIADAYLNTGDRYRPATDTWTSVSKANAPVERDFHTAVWTGTEMIVWGGWSNSLGHLKSGGRYDPASDSWVATGTGAGVPAERQYHTAVWTGARMIVYGGLFYDSTGGCYSGASSFYIARTGGSYDPATDSWTPTATGGCTVYHTAVWGGDANGMIVYGGRCSLFSACTNGGQRYLPSSNSWTPLAGPGNPGLISLHAAAWAPELGTAGRMFIWGGTYFNGSAFVDSASGAMWDPVAGWISMTDTGRPAARDSMASAWTGSKFLVWGGSGLNSGGVYDPALNSWSATQTAGAPTGRTFAIGRNPTVWSGSEFIIWGSGSDNTAARYSPASNSWAAVTTPGISTGIPAPRTAMASAWTGSELIVWGGLSTGTPVTYYGNGGRYNPALDAWSVMSATGAPAARRSPASAWNGSKLMLWGGATAGSSLSGGYEYSPALNSWNTLPATGVTPGTRDSAAGLWTGTEFFVFGGHNFVSGVDSYSLADGARYNPSSSSWSAIPAIGGGLSGRDSAAVMWTGAEMVVWGGVHSQQTPPMTVVHGTGGRYDPAANGWTPLPAAGAPAQRYGMSAVWTGSELVLWGGRFGYATDVWNNGAAWSASGNSWRPLSAAGSPAARSDAAAAWTGTDGEMMIWGGSAAGAASKKDGAFYYPADDAWSPMNQNLSTPSPRGAPATAWTGEQFIVWGGSIGGDSAAQSGGGGVYSFRLPHKIRNTLRAAKSSSVDLTWGPISNATHYLVKRCDASAGGCVPGAITLADQTATTYSASDLSDSISYFYSVESANACGSRP